MLAQQGQLLPPDHPVAVVVHVDEGVPARIRRIELPAVGSKTRLVWKKKLLLAGSVACGQD